MIKRILIQIFISIVLIASGLALMFKQNWLLDNFGMLTLSLGLICLFVLPARTHIKYSKNINVLITYLIIFQFINVLRHYMDFYLILNLKEYLDFMFHPRSTIYLIGLTIWLFGLIWTTVFIVKTIRRNAEYKNVIKDRSYKIVIGYIILMLMLELPIYNWHGDFFGQSHGHSLWDKFHLH